MEVHTFNGARYFVPFIDDYSKKLWHNDQKQRSGVRIFSKVLCDSRARDMIVTQSNFVPTADLFEDTVESMRSSIRG